MDVHQLKTFVAVAREGSVTRASERLHLSQPAVSAHIKALEDALGLALFERTARGMSLTSEGERLLVKAERTLAAHRELMDEATRIKGGLAGKLRLGAGSGSSGEAMGRFLATLAERCRGVEVSVSHRTSLDNLAGLRDGTLDAAFYNEPGDPGPELETLEVARFKSCLVAPPGRVAVCVPPDWDALARLTWIYPASSSCCGQTAEAIFRAHRIRPTRIVSVDREDVTRTLIAQGIGVGLVHSDTAEAARARGEIELLYETPAAVRVLFAHLADRAHDPVLMAAASILRGEPAA